MALEYNNARVIIGEGKADRAFFAKLVAERKLAGYTTDFPKLSGDHAGGGWSQFGRYLQALEVSESFQRNVRHVVMVGDHDSADAFDNICKELKAAGYKTPKAVKQFAKTPKKPDIAILLIPDTAPGCLETLCYQAARTKWPNLEGPLDAYVGASSAAGWNAVKQAKMRVQCLLAANCEEKPDVALQDHWQKDLACHIPVNDPVFDPIAAFLASVP